MLENPVFSPMGACGWSAPVCSSPWTPGHFPAPPSHLHSPLGRAQPGIGTQSLTSSFQPPISSVAYPCSMVYTLAGPALENQNSPECEGNTNHSLLALDQLLVLLPGSQTCKTLNSKHRARPFPWTQQPGLHPGNLMGNSLNQHLLRQPGT